MVKEQKTADVSFESLLKIFTVPEGPDSTLTKIDESLSRNLNQFLREHIVAEEKPLREIEKDFSSAQILSSQSSCQIIQSTYSTLWCRTQFTHLHQASLVI